MAIYAAFHQDVTDESGNLLTNVQVRVTNEVDGSQPQLYDGPDSTTDTALGNPYTQADGKVYFHCVGGSYKIVLTSGAYTRTRRYTPIGRAGETDLTVTTPMGAWSALTTYGTGDLVGHTGRSLFVSLVDSNLNNTPDAATPGDTAYWMFIGYGGLIGAWEDAWVTATAYALNDVVGFGGASFICTEAHTSGTFATDLAAGKWALVADSGWMPEFAIASDGSRRVLQLTGWVGGYETEPTDHVNEYVGAAGFTTIIGDAVDIRGADGNFSGTEVTKTSAYTALVGDGGKTIILDKATADTLSFDPSATLGSNWMVMVKNVGAGTWTFDPYGTETIDGALTIELAEGESAIVSSNGTALRSFFLGGTGGGGITPVASTTAMAALNTSVADIAYLQDMYKRGMFFWHANDLSAVISPVSVTSTSIDAGTDTITSAAHKLLTGDVVVATTAVNGLSLDTFYYVIRVAADTFRLASSLANAIAGTAVDLTGTTNFTVKRIIDEVGGVFVIPSGGAKDGSDGAWIRDHNGEEANVKWFGAKGDGKQIRAACSITSGTATLTVTGAAFTADIVGKIISVEGAGAASATLFTSVAGYISPTEITLNANASTTLAAATKTVFYGTDDSDAFDAAVKSLTLSLSSTSNELFGGRVIVPGSRGFYMLGRSIRIPGHGIDVIGTGGVANTCIVVSHAGKGLHFENNYGGSSIQRSTRVSGLRFLSGESTRTAGSAAIWFNYSLNWIVEFCWLAARQQYAIYGQDVQDFHVRNVRIDGPVEDSNNGFTHAIRTLGVGNQGTIENCWVEGTNTSAITITGDASYSANQVTIRETLIQGCQGAGITYEKVNVLSLIRVWFESNGRSGTSGLSNIRNSGTAVCHVLNIDGCVFGGAGPGAHANFTQFTISYVVGFYCRHSYFSSSSIISISASTVIGGRIEHNWSFDAGPTVSAKPDSVKMSENRSQDTGVLWATNDYWPEGILAVKTADFTVADTESDIVNNKGSACVATLPNPASYKNRVLNFTNHQAFALTSASANVVPRTGGAAGAAILPATDGAWCRVKSDGTSWLTLQGS